MDTKGHGEAGIPVFAGLKSQGFEDLFAKPMAKVVGGMVLLARREDRSFRLLYFGLFYMTGYAKDRPLYIIKVWPLTTKLFPSEWHFGQDQFAFSNQAFS